MASRAPWAPLDPAGPLQRTPPSDRDGRAAYFTAQIKDWLANRKQQLSAYVSPEEIGKAEDRGFLLRRALVDSIAAYYRQCPGAPVAPGILVLDIVLSDNPEGGVEYRQCDTRSCLAAKRRRRAGPVRGTLKKNG
jgi:hypothetical protein